MDIGEKLRGVAVRCGKSGSGDGVGSGDGGEAAMAGGRAVSQSVSQVVEQSVTCDAKVGQYVSKGLSHGTGLDAIYLLFYGQDVRYNSKIHYFV